MNEFQKSFLNNDVKKIIELTEDILEEDNYNYLFNVPLRISRSNDTSDTYLLKGLILDYFLEVPLLVDNRIFYLERDDFESWDDIVELVDNNTKESIFIPAIVQTDDEDKYYYLIPMFAEKNICDIKDGEVLRNSIVDLT